MLTNKLKEVQDSIGYQFKDSQLLRQALTHVSYANDYNEVSYERLEFLGDAVIELVVSTYIYNNLEIDAGNMTKLRSSLVSTEYLCNRAKVLGLEKCARTSKSLKTLSKKNIADLFESVVGAVYIDGGLDIASRIVLEQVVISEDNVGNVIRNSIDYKSRVQELLQKEGVPFNYEVLSSSGLDHDKTFEVCLKVDGKEVSRAIARSIQLAEEGCAEIYLNALNSAKY